jgi:hypothetical protein
MEKKITLFFTPYFWGKDNQYSSNTCFLTVTNELKIGQVVSFEELNKIEWEIGDLNSDEYHLLANKLFVVCEKGETLRELTTDQIEFMFYQMITGNNEPHQLVMIAHLELFGVKCPKFVLVMIEKELTLQNFTVL